MVIAIKKEGSKESLNALISYLDSCGVNVDFQNLAEYDLLTVTGAVYKIDVERVRAFDVVERVKRITEPFMLASRKFCETDTVIKVCGRKIGGDNFTIIAGPCAVESEKSIMETAIAVKKAGADFLRGGAFKPRTSPYSFQGLKEDGIKFLLKAKRETGLPLVSEITSEKSVDLFYDVDVVQIGARNMQNYALIREVAKMKKPVLLKRGTMASVEELLMSAEYLLSEGAKDVILCERGIKTFEPVTRSSLDLSSLPALKEITHLPVIADPSHAAGYRRFVAPLSYAAAAVGAKGLMIEVSDDHESALSDGAQAVSSNELKEIIFNAKKIQKLLYKPEN